MPKFSKKIEIQDVGKVACMGTLVLGKEVRGVKTGSGLKMIFVAANPHPSTEGVSATVNFMLHPDWLAKDFDPESLASDSVSVAKAKARIARAKDANKEPSDEDKLTDRNSRQLFVYQRNIYANNGSALLQNMLGKGFDPFADAVSNKSSEEFLKMLREGMEKMNKKVLFVYECKQSKNQDGELMNRMEITALYRIEKGGDLESWLNKAKARGIEPLFDAKAERLFRPIF